MGYSPPPPRKKNQIGKNKGCLIQHPRRRGSLLSESHRGGGGPGELLLVSIWIDADILGRKLEW